MYGPHGDCFLAEGRQAEMKCLGTRKKPWKLKRRLRAHPYNFHCLLSVLPPTTGSCAAERTQFNNAIHWVLQFLFLKFSFSFFSSRDLYNNLPCTTAIKSWSSPSVPYCKNILLVIFFQEISCFFYMWKGLELCSFGSEVQSQKKCVKHMPCIPVVFPLTPLAHRKVLLFTFYDKTLHRNLEKAHQASQQITSDGRCTQFLVECYALNRATTLKIRNKRKTTSNTKGNEGNERLILRRW